MEVIYWIYASCGAYLLACGLPAYVGRDSLKINYLGWGCLMLGIFLFENPLGWIAWACNWLYAGGLVARWWGGSGWWAILSALAIFGALGAWAVRILPKDEAGNTTPVRISVGWWVWWAAMWLALVAWFW